MIIRKDTDVRLPVRLLDPVTGAGVVGMLPTDIVSSGVPGDVFVSDSEGGSLVISLNDGGTSWFEIDPVRCPGLYHVLVPAAATSVIGGLQLSVLPAAAAFLPTIVTACVETSAEKIEDMAVEVTDVISTLVTINDNVVALGDVPSMLTDLADEAFGKWEIATTGEDANRLILYRADGETVLKKFDLLDENEVATTTSPFARIPVEEEEDDG